MTARTRFRRCGGGDISHEHLSQDFLGKHRLRARQLLLRLARRRPIPRSPRAIEGELGRQRDEIELIASENIVSPRRAGGAGLGADQQIRRGLSGPALLWRLRVRRRRRERWRSSAPRSCSAAGFANVQPNSGSQANQAVFLALLQPGDTFMGLDLAAGGHLTHGSPVNMSRQMVQAGALQRAAARTSSSTWTQVAKLAQEHKPKLIIAGGSAYPRVWDFKRFREIADERRRVFHGRHGAFRRPGGGRRASLAVAARPRRHHHHAQDAARPARRHDPHQRRGARQEDQLGGVPRPAGRPADARDRRQGGGVRRGAAARVQDLRAERRRERQGAGRNAAARPASTSSPAAPTTT